MNIGFIWLRIGNGDSERNVEPSGAVNTDVMLVSEY
jgi:hypothetical protein